MIYRLIVENSGFIIIIIINGNLGIDGYLDYVLYSEFSFGFVVYLGFVISFLILVYWGLV